VRYDPAVAWKVVFVAMGMATVVAVGLPAAATTFAAAGAPSKRLAFFCTCPGAALSSVSALSTLSNPFCTTPTAAAALSVYLLDTPTAWPNSTAFLRNCCC
jgi:hypothetical protein